MECVFLNHSNSSKNALRDFTTFVKNLTYSVNDLNLGMASQPSFISSVLDTHDDPTVEGKDQFSQNNQFVKLGS